MEGHCSTGQSPQWAVVPMEEEKEEEEEEEDDDDMHLHPLYGFTEWTETTLSFKVFVVRMEVLCGVQKSPYSSIFATIL